MRPRRVRVFSASGVSQWGATERIVGVISCDLEFLFRCLLILVYRVSMRWSRMTSMYLDSIATSKMDETRGSLSQDEQVQRYCSQYLQLEPSPVLPAPEILREASVQEAIFDNVFAEHAVRYGPPVRYQLRMLKQLVAQIEASIEDWDEHVSARKTRGRSLPMLSTVGGA